MDLEWIADTTGAASATLGQRLQSLWRGYGEIVRVHLKRPGDAERSVVVKWVKPPEIARGNADASHARKFRSYEVEHAFYRRFAVRCDDDCRVARLLGSRRDDDEWVFVLEDLDAAGFAGRRHDPSPREVEWCLAWLAALHATFLGTRPDGLWETGTYWHLATRAEELAAIDDDELRAAAPLLDAKLRAATFQTIVHGDAKPANFCFGRSGVAAVDFQYAGGGCGMKDVAYLLGDDVADEPAPRALDVYFRHLRERLAASSVDVDVDVDALEREWRALYPIARADYHRFLAGWAKGYWSRNARAARFTGEVLRALRRSLR